jgi:hypothetical protein
MGDDSTDEYSPLSEADLAFLNDSLGISTDGVRQSAAWRLSNYGDSGALTDAQIERLVAQFSLSRNQLRELSWYLGHALGGVPTIILVGRSKAAAEAAAEIAQAIKDLADAARKLEKAKDRLARLCVDDDFGPDGQNRLSDVKNQLAQSQDGVQIVKDALLEVSETPGFALLLRHADTRNIPDYRRSKVLSQIMSFWHSIGRKLTYTTDPSNSERRGELIDFVNAIVGCISDPPGKLSGESIIAAIKKHKAWVDHDVSVLDD